MPEATIASAASRMSFSLTSQPNLFQLFQPMGGVSATVSAARAGPAASNPARTNGRRSGARMGFSVLRWSGLVDGLGHAVRGSRGGLHPPVQVVRVGPDELDAAFGLDHPGPEPCELLRGVVHGLAGHDPRVLGPVDHERLLDVVGLAGVVLPERRE